jgi:hypothetical protein
LKTDLELLNLDGFELQSHQVVKNGFKASKVNVIVKDDVPERHLAEILAVVNNSLLPDAIKIKAAVLFTRLAEVEAGIHGMPLDQVHLHELGGIDTIVDIVGVLLGLAALNVEKVFSSPLPLGRGFIRGAHGQIPLPSPATVALLKGVPVIGSDLNFELVTPTGAALLTAIAESFGPIPAMTLKAVGYGAGGRDLPIPNIIRILLGETELESARILETLVSLETNIDDLTPQVYEHLIAKLFQQGALDVTLTPIQMKKNRPAVQVWLLCRPQDASNLENILFEETTTLGIRRSLVERHSLPRSFETVETPYGQVKVKLAHLDKGKKRAVPEYEDCKKLAQEHGVPLWEVYLAAQKMLNLDN